MRRLPLTVFLTLALLAALVGVAMERPAVAQQARAAPAQLAERIPTKPFLNMPDTAAGPIPRLLSDTGVFSDVRSLTPVAGLLPYELDLAFWSDSAVKGRYVAIPQGKVDFSPDGEWTFPRGTVFVKTFNLTTDAAHPDQQKRLETRLLVLDSKGGVYGVSYKWRADLSDAELVGAEGLDEDIPIQGADGPRTQTWSYPSRENCLKCHNAHTNGQLGPKTRQLNFPLTYPDGSTENQLARWNRLGLFSTPLNTQELASYVTLAKPDDASRSLEDRARSYLDANCAQCHRPGGTVAGFDARFQTPLAQQNLINGPVLIDNGIDRARIVSPHDTWRSMIIRRTDTVDDTRMPPIARHTIDANGVALLKSWILSLPGRDVLAPPAMSPIGGDFKQAVTVTLTSPDPGAEIHYTTDGSAPAASDPLYDKPIRLEGPTVLRARAFKTDMTNSIIVQQTYVVDPPP